ncbi:hypothetical protein NFI96_006539 [Prochilodus magdalenae]|nr:hypothetical protein NFI96_006539 [Prochilodus magdalenae]
MNRVVTGQAPGGGEQDDRLLAGGSDVERTKKKRRGDRYSVQTSLIVAALKKMLPIGLNMCSPADQELINLAKIRYSLKDTDEEVREFLQNNLHLQGKVEDPSMRWQMALYKEMAGKAEDADAPEKVVKRVQEVAAVLYHIEVTEHPFKSKKMVWHKLLSKQRRRAVVACFRMTPLYNLPRHRASNMFLDGYKRNWLQTEGYSFEDRMIDDLSKAMEQEEEEEEETETKPDPLHQLILHFSRTALTEKSKLDIDYLYMAYADIMAKSCHIGEEDEGEEEDQDGGAEEMSFEVRQSETVMLAGGRGQGHQSGTEARDFIIIILIIISNTTTLILHHTSRIGLRVTPAASRSARRGLRCTRTPNGTRSSAGTYLMKRPENRGACEYLQVLFQAAVSRRTDSQTSLIRGAECVEPHTGVQV